MHVKKINKLLLTKLNIEKNTINDLVIEKIPLSHEAKNILHEFSQYIEKQQRKENKYHHIKANASKASEMCARIAAVLTLFENKKTSKIEAHNMQNAIKLTEVYLNETNNIMNKYTASQEILHAQKILEWLQYNKEKNPSLLTS
ncbi:DUF3987 domain-containing protein [Candidatus Xenohaliotis californiensis]